MTVKLEYTHEALIEAGYVRRTEKDHGQPGFVCYNWMRLTPVKGRRPYTVAWAGNSAMTNEWIEKISNWEKLYPKLYAWWLDPTQKEPYSINGEIIIKGEDPLKKEGQNGSTSPKSGV